MPSSCRPLAVLNVVGLTPSLLAHAPRMRDFANGDITPLIPAFPAVTCSVQSSMLTGLPVAEHGIVGNGWYNTDQADVRFWQRSDRLVHGEKVWETAKKQNPDFTCANLFWWHNAYSTCDTVVQARPIYKADGRKIPDVYCNKPAWRDILQSELGTFPLFHFWGPLANIQSTQWIADAAMHTHDHDKPNLTLVYLPHLDYGLQKLGPQHPDIPHQVIELDKIVGDLIDHFTHQGTQVLIVSEYGIEATRPTQAAIFINRHLRDAGHLALRNEEGLETLDPGACTAFAVADHQAAHVYFSPHASSDQIAQIETLCRSINGVQDIVRLNHPRAGHFTLVAAPGHWFTYDWWHDDAKAPDYARTVDIHRKPGYDPRELFSDASQAAVAFKLAKKKLGFSQLMNIIPLDTHLVRGTHGRTDLPTEHGPLLIGAQAHNTPLPATAVRDQILRKLGLR
ncbi:MAG: nucleotide pyrophosphatase/phosphodiesterase family protein [Algisphaera sp.]